MYWDWRQWRDAVVASSALPPVPAGTSSATVEQIKRCSLLLYRCHALVANLQPGRWDTYSQWADDEEALSFQGWFRQRLASGAGRSAWLEQAPKGAQ